MLFIMDNQRIKPLSKIILTKHFKIVNNIFLSSSVTLKDIFKYIERHNKSTNETSYSFDFVTYLSHLQHSPTSRSNY